MSDKKNPSKLPETLLGGIYTGSARRIAHEGLLPDIRNQLLKLAGEHEDIAPEAPDSRKIFAVILSILLGNPELRTRIEKAVDEMCAELKSPEAQGILFENLPVNSKVFDIVVETIRGSVNDVISKNPNDTDTGSNVIPFPGRS